MKNKEYNGRKSIGNTVRYTFITIILLVGLGFIFSLYENKVTSKKYDVYANMNTKLSSLSAEFNNSWNHFNNFISAGNKEDIKQYDASNLKINRLLSEVGPYINRDVQSGIFYRNLNNMFEYYEAQTGQMIGQVLHLKKLNPNSYAELTNIKTLFGYMNRHSQLLEIAYLNFSNHQYSLTVMKYKDAETQVFIVLIVTVLIGSFYTMVMTRNLNKTIGRLRKYAEHLSDAKWEIPDLKDQKYDELNSLANAFNKMKNSIRLFIQELNEKAEVENNYHIEMRKSAEKDKLIRETQLFALQSQMDPHFLFNTMNTISRMAMFESAEQTVKLIEATSKILRYNLDYKDKMVKLREEIRMIEAYVVIQETRFQDQMRFSFDIDKSLEGIDVPPMLIQPIVENAIIHGLKEKDKDGIINIGVREQNDCIEISIKDNGIGMDSSKIENLLREDKNRKNGLGIFNVKKRLELYYNRQDLLRINSHSNEGTEVTIIIPVKGCDIDA